MIRVGELIGTASLEKKGLAYRGNGPYTKNIEPEEIMEIPTGYCLIKIGDITNGGFGLFCKHASGIGEIYKIGNNFSTSLEENKICIIHKSENVFQIINKKASRHTISLSIDCTRLWG